jgi:hypothetical protein
VGEHDRKREARRDRTREGRRSRGYVDPETLAVQKASYVDQQIRAAMERGEFDDLPLQGKPIPGLGGTHDPDWWVRRLLEREQISGVLPEALQLRKDDAALDASLDRLGSASAVREAVEAFNTRVVEARRQLRGGPPVITPTRDVEVEVERWTERRRARRSG